MAYLTKDELKTHLYGENIDEITRENDTLVDNAIAAAIAEAKSYLSKYDVQKMFSDEYENKDPALKLKVKDIACWHLLTISNANVNLEVFETRYDYAIKNYFIAIMKGQMDPQGWPYKQDDPDSPFNESGTISWTSNKKRTNNF